MRILIDFKPELPQMIIAKEISDDNREVKIINVIKGKEALDMYDQLKGGEKND